MNLALGNFAQSRYHLTILADEEWGGTFEQLFCALRGDMHQRKPIIHKIKAVFNRDTGHWDSSTHSLSLLRNILANEAMIPHTADITATPSPPVKPACR
jgi:hypothetical protein